MKKSIFVVKVRWQYTIWTQAFDDIYDAFEYTKQKVYECEWTNDSQGTISRNGVVLCEFEPTRTRWHNGGFEIYWESRKRRKV